MAKETKRKSEMGSNTSRSKRLAVKGEGDGGRPQIPNVSSKPCKEISVKRKNTVKGPSSSEASAKVSQEPSKREIIVALSSIVEGVDLYVPFTERRDLWERLLEDLCKHFCMDLTKRDDVRGLILAATCKELAASWRGFY